MSIHLYISIAYYMQKGGGWVQIACKIAYVLNGRALCWWFSPLILTNMCTFRYNCTIASAKHMTSFESSVKMWYGLSLIMLFCFIAIVFIYISRKSFQNSR